MRLYVVLLSGALLAAAQTPKHNDNILDPKCGVVQYGDPVEEGRDFTIGFVEVPDDKSGQKRQFLVKVTTDRDKELGVVASVPQRSGLISNYTTVSKGKVATMDLSGNQFLNARGASVFSASTVKVTASADFKVFVSSQQGQRKFGYWAIPDSALGSQYMVVTYAPLDYRKNDKAECGIIAVDPGTTRVRINLPARRFDFSNEHLAVFFNGQNKTNGQFFDLVLNQNDFAQLQATKGDFTGAYIDAKEKKRIAVICGNTLVSMGAQVGLIGDTGTSDTMIEQLPPIDTWGENFISYVPSADRSFYMQYRLKIVAAYPNTQLWINGQYKKLMATETTEVKLQQRQSVDLPVVVKSTKPILVAQFVQSWPSAKMKDGRGKRWATSDAYPSMVLLTAVEQWVQGRPILMDHQAPWYAADQDSQIEGGGGLVNTLKAQYCRRFTFDAAKYDYRPDWTYSYFLIVSVEAIWKNSLRLNGGPLDMAWIEAGEGGKYQTGYKEVAWGQHTIDATDQRAVFGAWLYGAQRDARGSFGYALGLNLRKSTCETCDMIGCELRDNDCDRDIDEEIEDGLDNDGDGRIDEDICGYWEIQGMDQNTLWYIIGGGTSLAVILGIIAAVVATQ